MPLIRSLLHMLWLILTVIPWALFAVIASLFVSSNTMYWMCARWLKLAVDSLKERTVRIDGILDPFVPFSNVEKVVGDLIADHPERVIKVGISY